MLGCRSLSARQAGSSDARGRKILCSCMQPGTALSERSRSRYPEVEKTAGRCRVLELTIEETMENELGSSARGRSSKREKSTYPTSATTT